MAYAYSDLLTQAREWARTAHEQGRIDAEHWALIEQLERAQADPLFVVNDSACDDKPLIVAFMGGTGVGKSSLLNRLAGQPVAKAGVVRPTSREVTLYHHHCLSPGSLPTGLPLESIRISQHHDDKQRRIVWVDMPDFDSVELDNRRLVLEWLPHIDVLLYVVSPERYRDHKAWQLLLAEGAKHAWLFVMNQWDRGQVEQFEDFKHQLARAGFNDPLVYRSCCNATINDEFDALLAQLAALSNQQSISQLRQHGEQWRLSLLQKNLIQLREVMQRQNHGVLSPYLFEQWPKFAGELQSGLAWSMQQMAKLTADRLGQQTEFKLWDDWAQSRFNDFLDQLVLQADQAKIAGKPLKAGLMPLRQEPVTSVDKQCALAARQAMLNPGNPTQRALIKLIGVAETMLPIAAMSIVGYQVFVGYYHSTTDAAAYLGGDFAIHSVLLIGLSWFIPFFLHKKLQPSIEKAALRGLENGFRQVLCQLKGAIDEQLGCEQNKHQQLQTELEQLIQRCQQATAFERPDHLLSRTLQKTDKFGA